MTDATAGEATSDRRRRRRFGREIGSIALGVLIALAIGEVADAIRWRLRLDRSAAAMRTEMAGNRFNLGERWLLRPCVARRLDEIERLIAARRTGAVLPMIASIGRPPDRVSERAAFDVALSDGVLLHAPIGEARDIALAYSVTVDDFARESEAEPNAWTTLAIIERSPGPIDGDTVLTLRQALGVARASAHAIETTIHRSDRLLAGKRVPIEFGRYVDASGLSASLAASAIRRPLT
ncbi:hypothetical protein GGQ80_001984 [Sphingomonas jinjuensis]|uniref:Uncharacterized protein n=1 Tax=Sphingomonas jinjuensis TaxID=535907 RepID=A0A840FEB0_9SPHN|nr:hypothetical protein [Sphingomonas jinjuensis]MBB4154074.1 hypothetical protein [Sphingomonas jinjuensis]